MKIYCLNPPFHRNYSSHQRSPAVTKSRTLYYPIWLAYAAGLLESHGFDVQLVDGPGEDITFAEAVRSRPATFAPQLVVVATTTPSISNDIRAADALKESHRRLHRDLWAPTPRPSPLETLEAAPTVDAVTRQEYDWTLSSSWPSCSRAAATSVPEGVAGITWRREGGELVTNPERPKQRTSPSSRTRLGSTSAICSATGSATSTPSPVTRS